MQLHVSASQQEWFYHNIPIRDEESLESVGVVHRSIVEVRPVPGVPHSHHGGRASSSAAFSEEYR